MSNLFDEDAYREDVPLMTLATGVVMPEEISEQLFDAPCLGAARMKLFGSKCINACKELGTGCSVRENRKTMDCCPPLMVSRCISSVPITKQ